MSMGLLEIIERSGDSIFHEYNYSKGLLTLKLEIDELDRDLFLQIKTNRIDCQDLEKLGGIEKNCRIELLKLDDIIETQNGFYIPARPFSEFMKECKKGFNLAYGLRSSDSSYLFSIVGYSRLLTCIITHLNNDIEWELKE